MVRLSLVLVTPSEQEPRWLDEGEMRAWRTYVNGSSMLMDRLHRELQDTHGVSLADYEILVRLSEQPNRRMRMTQLAEDVASSKSRVSHQVARMEKAGLVSRRECTEDGRGVLAELTPAGMTQLIAAAPTHLRGVREHIVDLLTPEEGEVLAKVFDRVMTHLRESNG
jgi:DNA-binding MarR family transcriptional regulator